MNGKKLSDALGELDVRYVEEALAYKKKGKRLSWAKWAGIAAAFCIIFALAALFGRQLALPVSDQEGTAAADGGVAIPAPKVSLSASNGTADMVSFFIYQGRVYTYCGRIDGGETLAGERLGAVAGLVDEWTPEEGYVELAGSVRGDFYAVNGFAPSFMLCMKKEDGTLSFYLCRGGFTLHYGSELFEDRLHLSGNVVSVSYESQDSWYQGKGERVPLDSHGMEAVNDLIGEMNAARFLWTGGVPLGQGEDSFYDKVIYYLYFEMKNGMTIQLGLAEGGYLFFHGIPEACVQVPEDVFLSLTDLFG